MPHRGDFSMRKRHLKKVGMEHGQKSPSPSPEPSPLLPFRVRWRDWSWLMFAIDPSLYKTSSLNSFVLATDTFQSCSGSRIVLASTLRYFPETTSRPSQT